MHTHHSHSGQFCQHAKNTLEEMVQRAIELKFEQFCMSEHMHKLEDAHLYPEEIESKTTPQDLATTFDAYFTEARRLQKKYEGQIEILVGFETEGINHDYLKEVELTIQKYKPDYFVGSLHHCDTIPIDFDEPSFERAVTEVGEGSLDRLVFNYYVQLHGLIARLRPPVIGHYDLIRLYRPDFDLKSSRAWPTIVRTIQLAVRADCLFELNAAAIRKGWKTPYPQHDIAEKVLELGGKLCLSDDSHNIDQVGTNYHKVLPYVESLGVKELWRLQRTSKGIKRVSFPVAQFREWVEARIAEGVYAAAA